MIKRSYLAAIGLMALGGVLGYAAASGKLNPFARADAAPPGEPATAQSVEKVNCCADGLDKASLLVKAETRGSGANQKADNAGKKPNIVFIMGDDIGMWNIGAYHRGMMAGRTPNLDKLAKEGMLFTDYYAEASCTAGRANFITGELPIRTGMTTVGQAGAKTGLPATTMKKKAAVTNGGQPLRATRTIESPPLHAPTGSGACDPFP
jgi:arylsulfatase